MEVPSGFLNKIPEYVQQIYKIRKLNTLIYDDKSFLSAAVTFNFNKVRSRLVVDYFTLHVNLGQEEQ